MRRSVGCVGSVRIVKTYGPPGTGKTTRLLGRVMEERTFVEPFEMAYLSFSVAAKEVVKERLALKEQDVRWFRTIHGACSKHLGLSGSIIQSQHYNDFQSKTGMKITMDDYDEVFERRDMDFNVALRAHQLSITQMAPLRDVIRELPDHPNLQWNRITNFIDAWEKYKDDNRLYDFMDMLVYYHREGTPLPVRVGFLDEAQDLSKLQWACVEKMFENCERLYMAGDDDQAIYTFLGASEYGFLEHKCDEEEVLTKSYRVPRLIGRTADAIIQRVEHRKDKAVEWRDTPGTVSRVNRDAMSMNWRKITAEFPRTEAGPGIMVLTRHRKGAHAFSKDLKLSGVAHSLHGETMNTWPEARVLHAIYSLRDGKTITPKQATALASALGRDTEKYREMGRRERVSEIEGVNIATLDFLSECSPSKRTRLRYQSLTRLVSQSGYEALAAEPAIVVSTMHASKGREAPLVIIVPDCTNVVKQNINTPTERRLSYVSLTRAKQEVYLIIPRTDTYIQHFFQ